MEAEKSQTEAAKRVGENLYLRNGVYYAVIRSHGKQVWRSLKTDDRLIAKTELVRVKRKLTVAGVLVNKAQVPSFLEAKDEFATACEKDGIRPRYLGSVKDHLRIAGRSFLGAMSIAAIQEGQLREYLRGRYAETSGRTANMDLIHLRKLFRHAVVNRWRWDDPTTNIKAFHHTKKKAPVPSWDEIAAVLTALRTMPIKCGKKAADFVELLALSGLRFSEAQALKWGDIDFEKRLLMVRHGKFDKPRIVDLFPALFDFLTKLSAGKKRSALLFPPRLGRGFDPRAALHLGCLGAKVRPFSFHGLRHAWATRLVEQGVDFATIAKWMGHSDGGMLVAKRYGTHSRRDHFQMVAQSVDLKVLSSVTA